MSNDKKPKKKAGPANGLAKRMVENQSTRLLNPKQRPDATIPNHVGKVSQLAIQVYEAIDLIKLGWTSQAIRQKMESTINPNTNRPFAPRFVTDILRKASAIVKKGYKLELKKAHGMHIARYNAIMNDLLTREYTMNPNAPWLVRKQEIEDLTFALATLKQKEELLGMHRKAFRVIINNQLNLKVQRNVLNDDVDFNVLEFSEQVELMELIHKCRSLDSDGIILKQQKEQEIKEYVEYEEVMTQADVHKIEKIDKSLIGKKNQGTTLSKVQQAILDSQNAAFEKIMANKRKVISIALNARNKK